MVLPFYLFYLEAEIKKLLKTDSRESEQSRGDLSDEKNEDLSTFFLDLLVSSSSSGSLNFMRLCFSRCFLTYSTGSKVLRVRPVNLYAILSIGY